ncbi:MAG TPA: hypothetical protein VGG79_21845 [Roseiarcus sp.]
MREMISIAVSTANGSALIDFHEGGSSPLYLPTLLAPRWSDPAKKSKLEQIIDAFDPP